MVKVCRYYKGSLNGLLGRERLLGPYIMHPFSLNGLSGRERLQRFDQGFLASLNGLYGRERSVGLRAKP